MQPRRSPNTPNEVSMSLKSQTIRSVNSLSLRTESSTRSPLTASLSWLLFMVPVVDGGNSKQPYNNRLELPAAAGIV